MGNRTNPGAHGRKIWKWRGGERVGAAPNGHDADRVSGCSKGFQKALRRFRSRVTRPEVGKKQDVEVCARPIHSVSRSGLPPCAASQPVIEAGASARSEYDPFVLPTDEPPRTCSDLTDNVVRVSSAQASRIRNNDVRVHMALLLTTQSALIWQ